MISRVTFIVPRQLKMNTSSQWGAERVSRAFLQAFDEMLPARWVDHNDHYGLNGRLAPNELIICNFGDNGVKQAKQILSNKSWWINDTIPERPKVVLLAQEYGVDKLNLKELPEGVPVLCVSKWLVSQWASLSPGRPLFYLPPPIEIPVSVDVKKDIDVLIFDRKSNKTYSDRLLKLLEGKCEVKVLGKEDDRTNYQRAQLCDYFARSKVYVYCVSPILGWGAPEALGLQPLEALLCGATVFSNLYGGLTNSMVPGVNMHQLIDPEHDAKRILRSISKFEIDFKEVEKVRKHYSREETFKRLRILLGELDFYFEF